jgi:hypothetical protein
MRQTENGLVVPIYLAWSGRYNGTRRGGGDKDREGQRTLISGESLQLSQRTA